MTPAGDACNGKYEGYIRLAEFLAANSITIKLQGSQRLPYILWRQHTKRPEAKNGLSVLLKPRKISNMLNDSNLKTGFMN